MSHLTSDIRFANVSRLVTDYQLNNTKVTFTLKNMGVGGIEHKTPAPIKK